MTTPNTSEATPRTDATMEELAKEFVNGLRVIESDAQRDYAAKHFIKFLTRATSGLERENIALQQQLARETGKVVSLLNVCREYGWNGIENSKCADTFLRCLIEDLKQQLAEKQKLIELHCKDWSDDHTRLQEMVRANVPGADVDGDSYGVPGILCLAEMLVKALAESKAEVERMKSELVDTKNALTMTGESYGDLGFEYDVLKQQLTTAEARVKELVEALKVSDAPCYCGGNTHPTGIHNEDCPTQLKRLALTPPASREEGK